MIGIECFVLMPTDKARTALRRYCSDSSCTGRHGYHNASIEIGTRPVVWENNGDGRSYSVVEQKPARDDARWPSCCSCGYVFKDDDVWQLFSELIYCRDNGEEYTLRDAPLGAMWNADWYPDAWRGPDGISLVVKTPGGDWVVDGPSSDHGKEGPRWTRTGTLPHVTVRPSILIGGYHGFLTNGVLEAC